MLISLECVVDSEQNDFVVAVQLLSYIDKNHKFAFNGQHHKSVKCACVVMLEVFPQVLESRNLQVYEKNASDSACA